MKPATRDWAKKAENDFETALALMRRKKVLADSICFHCQQCVEKYLKARLEEASMATIKFRYIRSRVRSRVLFPLTPALSLGERESPCAALVFQRSPIRIVF